MSSEKYSDRVVDEMTDTFRKSVSMDAEDTDTYHRYIKEGKNAARQGDMSRSLELFNLAYEIHPSEKLKSRIKIIQEAIKELEHQESDCEDEFVNVLHSGLMLYKELYDKLYEHQKEGIAFLYGLHRDGKKGGILADDMGLGKTIQIIGFLSGMFDADQVKFALLLMPTSLIANWTKEFTKWTPGMRVKEFHGTNKTERNRNLEKIQRRGGVLITTYQMLINNWELLASRNGKEFLWDYVILDEAHKIKTSSTKSAKCARAVPAKHRVLLTGTPVQNNLREMWALFDFACEGALLGTSKTFKSEYENPITRAREKDATPGEKALGLKISENLMSLINPYFLRRTKEEVQNKKQDAENAVGQDSTLKENKDPNSGGVVIPSLTRKNDFIVWTYLGTIQEDIYRKFISLDHIKELLMTTRSPLAELNILKKLCDHPRLLSARAVAQLGLEEGSRSGSANLDDNESAACQISNIADETLIEESGKLTFLLALLNRLREEGCRTLVFSQSRKMLDIIERVLVNQGFKILRIDGTVLHLHERERRISLFQTNSKYSVFLLTTQVGGVGITLTAANRVVIFDPSWNPATDAQAVDRAYRIGQKDNVVIYRLITCGTVEEKIYRRQVFKDSLIRQTTGDKKNPFRYFSRQELKELFKLEDTRSSSTQLQLQAMHANQRRTDPQLDEHIAFLHTMEMFGLSDHDLMFSHDAAAHEDHPEDEESHVYIEHRVQKAQELMKAESELHTQLLDSIASNTEPMFLRKSDPTKNSAGKPVKLEPTFPVGSSSDGEAYSPVVDLESDEHNQSLSPDVSPVKVKSASPVSLNGNLKECSIVVDLTQAEFDMSKHERNMSREGIPVKEEPTSPLVPNSCNRASLSVVDLTQSASDVEECVQNASMRLSSLFISDTNEEDAEDSECSEKNTSEVRKADGADSINQSVSIGPGGHGNVAEISMMTSVGSNEKHPPVDITAQSPTVFHNNSLIVNANKSPKNLSFHSDKVGESGPLELDLELSVLHKSDNDNLASEISGNDSNIESFQGNFNLQLEDTDDSVGLEKADGLEEESPGVQLQMDSSSVHHDPIQSSADEHVGDSSVAEQYSVCIESEESVNESFVHNVYKKKKAQVIYDSDDEDGSIHKEEEKCTLAGSLLGESFQGLGSSTPKHQKLFAFSTPHRKSIGGNVSVASRRSLIEAVMDDVEDLNEDLESEDEAKNNDSEYYDCSPEVMSLGNESAMEEEEPSGETLNTEDEEEESGSKGEPSFVVESQMEEDESQLEGSTGDLELLSDEKMEQCTKANALSQDKVLDCLQNDGYDNLINRGRECYTKGKLKEALDCFLKALDIKSGDPEIQLKTIQLYRQLSQQ